MDQNVLTTNSPTFGGLTVTGTIITQEIHTEFVSASVTVATGSNTFGDNITDVHSITGSLRVSGSNFSVSSTGTVSSSATSTGSFGQVNVKSNKITSDSNGMHIFDQSGNRRWTVNNSGQIGIGLDDGVSAASRLEIEDSGTGASMLLKITQDDQNPYGLVIGNDSFSTTDTHGIRFNVNNAGTGFIDARGSGDENLIFQESGGNVGIGTASPDVTLHVQSSDQVKCCSVSEGTADQVRILRTGTSAGILDVYDDDGSTISCLIMGRSGYDSSILMHGNVGIGTYDPIRILLFTYLLIRYNKTFRRR